MYVCSCICLHVFLCVFMFVCTAHCKKQIEVSISIERYCSKLKLSPVKGQCLCATVLRERLLITPPENRTLKSIFFTVFDHLP